MMRDAAKRWTRRASGIIPLGARAMIRHALLAGVSGEAIAQELLTRGKRDGGLETLLRRLPEERLLAELARRVAKLGDDDLPLLERLPGKQRARIAALPDDETLVRELVRRAASSDLAASVSPRSLGEVVARLQPRRKLEYERHSLELVLSSGFIYKRLRAAQKEPFTVDWIERAVGPETVLYDIGANVGAYSLIAAKQGGGAARVYAFEPAAATFADLVRNVALNGCENSVVPMPISLWNRTGVVSFGYRSLDAGDASHSLTDDASVIGGAASVQQALAFRLDDVVRLFDLPLPTLVKLDVDGPELQVLEGAAETLSQPPCRELMIEVSGLPGDPNVVAITDRLGSYGFAIVERFDRGLGAYYLFGKQQPTTTEQAGRA